MNRNLVNILNLEITKQNIDVNSIFYIGLGKTGSASIFHGFPNRPCFHYHDYTYFNYVNGANLKSNQELIDLISNIGYMLGFNPVVIECTRNPMDRALSAIYWNYYNNKNLDHHDLFKMTDEELTYILNNYIKEKPFYKTVNIPKNIKHIILKLEDKNKWCDILKSYGINDYINKDCNINKDINYIKFKNKIYSII